MKKIITSSKYRLNWYKIVLFSVAMVLTGTYSITVKAQTEVPLTVNASVSAADKQSIAVTATSANTRKTTGSGTATIKDTGIANPDVRITAANQESKTLGNMDVYSSVSTSPNCSAQPVTFGEAGEIESISIYHNGGIGNVILGVYSMEYDRPEQLLGKTESTPINAVEGWQTLSLLKPLEVVPGQTIYLAWVFENNPGTRYTPGKPGIVKSWSTGSYMADYFSGTDKIDEVYSVYCTYKPKPYYLSLSDSPEPGVPTNKHIYLDWMGRGESFIINSNTSWIIKSDASWLNIAQTSGSNDATITLTASINGGKRDRTGTVTISGTGVTDKTLPVNQFYGYNITGNYDVYDSTSTTEYLTAQPITFDDAVKIQGIYLYHKGGTGKLLLGVYSDQYGSPSSLLGVSAPTTVNSMEGWQHIYLKEMVEVKLGQTVWLSWIFENNPGVRYTTGAPAAANSTSKWSNDMPNTFGIAANEGLKYSIFCDYQPSVKILDFSTRNILLGSDSGSSATVNITSNTSWIVRRDSGVDWIDLSPTESSLNGTITVTANLANTTAIPRTATFTILGKGMNPEHISVTQDAVPLFTATGNITYQVWNNIGTGLTVSSLTNNINYPNNPTSTKLITSMEGTTDLGDSYGARIVGYISAPATGSYTFWIASDDYGELWLSTNDDPANKYKIAYVNGYTWIRTWNKYPTQKSATINLVQGQKYYIEALMKEANGHDNLAVGWLKPGESGTVPSEVIPGSVLLPYGTIPVSSVTLQSALSLNTGASVLLSARVLPTNATVRSLNWTTSDPIVALVNSNGIVTGISAGSATISATSADGSNKTGTCVVTVAGVPTICSATGNITYQVWNNIGSSTFISLLTGNANYPDNPTSSTLINSMEGITNLGDSYGARIVGYICAPATGSYTFWIASDDQGELWLSLNDDPAKKRKIAYVNGYTWIREWNKYPTQKSVTINLVQGQKYYIEALMKEATGYDNLAVGWLKPGQSGTVPSQVIPGSVLSPFTEPVKNNGPKAENTVLSGTNVKLSVYPNPLMNSELNIKPENLRSEATLEIFTISGVKCYEKIIQNSGIIRVDRSVFISGIYIIKLQNENFVKTTKLIIN